MGVPSEWLRGRSRGSGAVPGGGREVCVEATYHKSVSDRNANINNNKFLSLLFAPKTAHCGSSSPLSPAVWPLPKIAEKKRIYILIVGCRWDSQQLTISSSFGKASDKLVSPRLIYKAFFRFSVLAFLLFTFRISLFVFLLSAAHTHTHTHTRAYKQNKAAQQKASPDTENIWRVGRELNKTTWRMCFLFFRKIC